jgi:hypothetical protein
MKESEMDKRINRMIEQLNAQRERAASRLERIDRAIGALKAIVEPSEPSVSSTKHDTANGYVTNGHTERLQHLDELADPSTNLGRIIRLMMKKGELSAPEIIASNGARGNTSPIYAALKVGMEKKIIERKGEPKRFRYSLKMT